MARNGTKSGGRNFKKGQVANPGGFTKEQALARKLTRDGLTAILNKMREMTHEEMQDHLGRPETPAFEMMIIKCYMSIMETGDMKSFNTLLDRLVGKVKDEVDVNVRPLTIKRRDGSEMVLGGGGKGGDES